MCLQGREANAYAACMPLWRLLIRFISNVHPCRQLHNSEKRAEQAAFDYRTSRLSSARSDDTYSMWD